MPIIYVHGVSIRDDRGWDTLEALLRQFVAPKISKDPRGVMIKRCFWGEHGAKFRWGGASAPTSPLREFSSSFSSSKIKQKAKKQLEQIEESIPETVVEVVEHLKRSVNSPGHLVARAAAEIKSPLNRFVTLFIGDVLTYLHARGDYRNPGSIQSCFLAAIEEARANQIERGGEPIIVMSHSMGGQIVYDALTHFMPKIEEYKDIKIDFWAATASQVGLFEELKLFLESSDDYSMETGKLAPFPNPRQLGYWWNVWDHNDFVSYSTRGIMDGVDDEHYNTGMFVIAAHEGYLELPTFFRKFGKKLDLALVAKR